MTLNVVAIFPALAVAVTLWLALVWLGARVTGGRSPLILNLGFGLVSVLGLFLPFDGLAGWKWIFGICPNPSLPLVGIVCTALWQRLFGRPAAGPADWRAIWIFGAIAGSALYLNSSYFGAVDLYYWGWDRGISIGCLAALAIAFFAMGNRLGVLFLAALIACAVNALESANGWDYVVDPFYWLIGLGRTLIWGIGWCVGRGRQNPAAA